MDVPEEKRRDAERTATVVRKKLLDIMDMQADIDVLLRHKHPSPFGSGKWKNARLETLQRLVLATAIQFILLEPDFLVDDNDAIKETARELLEVIYGQLKSLGNKPERE